MAKFFTERDLAVFLMTKPIKEFGEDLKKKFDILCDQVKSVDGSTGPACADQCEDYGKGVGKFFSPIWHFPCPLFSRDDFVVSAL